MNTMKRLMKIKTKSKGMCAVFLAALFAVVVQPALALEAVDLLTNPGFEVPDQGASGFTYTPSGATWTFVNGGLAGPSSPWKCNSTSPDPLGDQFAFMQSEATSSQPLSGLVAKNTYYLTFFESYRTAKYAGNDLKVILDEGLATETLIYYNTGVSNPTWEARQTDSFVAAKTSYTLTFRTTNPLGVDSTTIVDGVVVMLEQVGSGIAIGNTDTTNITASAAWATATVNTNLDTTMLVWDTTDHTPGTTNDWPAANRLNLGAKNAGTVTAQITGLDADTVYVWRMYGENSETNGWSDATSFGTAFDAVQTPVFTNAVALSFESILLGWQDKASQETGYILQRSTTEGSGYATVATLGPNVTTYEDSGLSPSTTYYYQLAATNSANGSSTDFALCATNVTTAVSPIFWSNLAASAITASGATLSAEMSGNDGDVTAYWTTNTVTDPATEVWDGSDGPAVESIGTVSRTASGLSVDTLYSYAFYGTNSTDGVEGWSIAGTFATALSAAQAPVFTNAVALSYKTILLGWQDKASQETGYILQRSTTEGSGYATVATLGPNVTTYEDSGLSPSTTYYYQLAATNSANGSSTEFTLCATNVTIAAHAGITVDDFAPGTATVTGYSTLTLSGFDATASDKLVVVASATQNGTTASPYTITGVTYNGVDLLVAAKADAHRAAGIFYLDSSSFSGAGDIVATFNARIYNRGQKITAFALSGTAPGFDDAKGEALASATITVAQAGSFVVAGNQDPQAFNLGPATLIEPVTGRGYQEDVPAGSYTVGTSGSTQVTVLGSFSPSPPPAGTVFILQ